MSKKDESAGTELETIRENNRNLAQLLARQQRACQVLFEEKTTLQKRLHSATVLIMRYQSVLENISCNTQQQMARLSNDAEQLAAQIYATDLEQNDANLEKRRPISPNSTNKTRAVQPMVSGHVIQRPTINLRRLSYTRHEETQTPPEVNHVSETNGNDTATNLNGESESLNQSENGRFRLFANRQPIRQLEFPNYDSDSEEEEMESTPQPQLTELSNLIPVVELELLEHELSRISEEPSNIASSESLSFKEKALTASPPETRNDENSQETDSVEPIPSTSSTLKYEPMPGPSTSAGDYHNRDRSRRYNHFMINQSDSDSDNSDNWESRISKRKLAKKRCREVENKTAVVVLEQISQNLATDITSNEINGTSNMCGEVENKRAVVVLEQISENLATDITSNEINDTSNINSGKGKVPTDVNISDTENCLPEENTQSEKRSPYWERPKRRRNVPNFKEPSLKRRLRRPKDFKL